MPGHWGLKGKTRLIAQAEYELQGLDLALRLAEINHENPQDQEKAKLDAKFKHGVLDAYEYDVQCARVQHTDDSELEQALLAIELKHHRISQTEHDRKLADLRGEPWVSMPDMKWDPSDPSRSYFELDYNEHFVTFLRANNYKGVTDEQVVDKWLNDVCRSVAQDFVEDDDNFVTPAPTARKVRKPRKGKAEYS